MFTIKKIEMVNKTFRMPMELVERLQTVAQQQGISLNNLVIQSCNYALENLGIEITEQRYAEKKGEINENTNR